MSKKHNKLDKLQAENDFLKKGIDSREEAFESIYNEKETQVRLVKELTYMLLHMEVIEDLIKNDHNQTSKIVKKAFAQLKHQLINGFYADGNTNNTLNDSTNEE